MADVVLGGEIWPVFGVDHFEARSVDHRRGLEIRKSLAALVAVGARELDQQRAVLSSGVDRVEGGRHLSTAEVRAKDQRDYPGAEANGGENQNASDEIHLGGDFFTASQPGSDQIHLATDADSGKPVEGGKRHY